MKRDEYYVEIEDLQTYSSGLDHPEGICVTADGAIYASGEGGQLYRLRDDGAADEIANTGGFLLGLAADGNDRVYACDLIHRCVWRIDPGDGRTEKFFTGSAAEPLTSPNWGAFDSRGSYYLSDSGSWKEGNGKIWLVPREGDPVVWSREPCNFPNGVALSPDESELWMLESTPPHLVVIPIREDGSAGERRVIAELPGTVPDGLSFTEDGGLMIACYRPDVVLRWQPEVGVTVLAEDPEGTALAAPTNLAFVGANRRTVLVPNIGRWHVTSFQTPLVGVTPFLPELGETAHKEED